jgi:DNA-binding MarR family transcriptional regulator
MRTPFPETPMATATQLTPDELLKVLHTALETFREDFDGDILASKILTLTAVAQNPGLQQVDVGRHVKGATTSSISRNVMDWSELDKNRKPGPEFIQQRPDPDYRRRNVLYLTPKGQHYLDRLTQTVNARLAGKRGTN